MNSVLNGERYLATCYCIVTAHIRSLLQLKIHKYQLLTVTLSLLLTGSAQAGYQVITAPLLHPLLHGFYSLLQVYGPVTAY